MLGGYAGILEYRMNIPVSLLRSSGTFASMKMYSKYARAYGHFTVDSISSVARSIVVGRCKPETHSCKLVQAMI